MTINEAITIALQEIDAQRTDYDESSYFPILDTAQKRIATVGKKIEKVLTVTTTSDTPQDVTLPTNFIQLINVEFRGLNTPVDYYWKSERVITLRDTGIIDIRYYAISTTITESTPTSTVFEVALETHNAIPYYLAYELAKTDDVTTAQIMLNEWDSYLESFKTTPKIITKQIINKYPLR